MTETSEGQKHLNNMNTKEIAERLIALCTEGNFIQAQKELYGDMIVNIETDGSRLEGLATIHAKEQQFLDSIERINKISFSEPLIAGSYFTVKLMMDLNLKNIGHRAIEEVCVYKVTDGKIVFEQFFRD